MAKTLDFNKVQKKYLCVVLADEKNTTLMIGTPTKAIMDDLLVLKASFDTLAEDETNVEATDDLYNACAKVMSRNKAGITITKEKLENLFDFEDIMIFFESYMGFIDEITTVKN